MHDVLSDTIRRKGRTLLLPIANPFESIEFHGSACANFVRSVVADLHKIFARLAAGFPLGLRFGKVLHVEVGVFPFRRTFFLDLLEHGSACRRCPFVPCAESRSSTPRSQNSLKSLSIKFKF